MKNEWDEEPNFAKWIDPATGLWCCIVRHPEMGHLCGYVRVPRKSKAYRYPERRAEGKFTVHGGVTFYGKLRRATGGTHRGKWVGFDCAHSGDAIPYMVAGGRRTGFASYSSIFHEMYRDWNYVKLEVEALAQQIGRVK